MEREAIERLREENPIHEVLNKLLNLPGYLAPSNQIHCFLCDPSSNRSRSLTYSKEGWFKCHRCDAKGDIFKLIELHNITDFKGAVEFLGGKWVPGMGRTDSAAPQPSKTSWREIWTATNRAITNKLIARNSQIDAEERMGTLSWEDSAMERDKAKITAEREWARLDESLDLTNRRQEWKAAARTNGK